MHNSPQWKWMERVLLPLPMTISNWQMSVDVEDGEEDDENEPLIESDDDDCDDNDA